MRILPFVKNHLWRIALTLACGLAGGYLFYQFQMPLPWMLGAMVVITALALAGVPVEMPSVLREPMVVIVAVMLGAAFKPEILGMVQDYLVSMTLLGLYMIAATAISVFYLMRFGGYDRPTAYFSSIPGGFLEMLLLGTSLGGDERRIFLTHGTRVFLVVLTIPFWFRLVEGYTPAGNPGMGAPFIEMSLRDLLILTACGIAGFYLGKWLRLPAYRFTGPLILSALAHLLGFTQSKPPLELIILAQLVLGAGVGTRYLGVRLREVFDVLKVAFVAALLLLSTAVLFTYAAHFVTGIKGQALLLSVAPGGLIEMTLIALALGIDVAFVTAHHLVRILLALFIAPVAYGLFDRKAGTKKEPGA